MALVISQKFSDFSNKFMIGITHVKLTAASDTLTVPDLHDSTSGVSCKQLERTGDATVTVANSNVNTVTLTGTIDDEVIIATIHAGNRNSIEEA